MKLKPNIRIAKGWKSQRIFLDVVETVWMILTPLLCGMLFGLSKHLIWLVIGVLPIFFKFVYKREGRGREVIYLR